MLRYRPFRSVAILISMARDADGVVIGSRGSEHVRAVLGKWRSSITPRPIVGLKPDLRIYQHCLDIANSIRGHTVEGMMAHVSLAPNQAPSTSTDDAFVDSIDAHSSRRGPEVEAHATRLPPAKHGQCALPHNLCISSWIYEANSHGNMQKL